LVNLKEILASSDIRFFLDLGKIWYDLCKILSQSLKRIFVRIFVNLERILG